jgi:hypothetical protein
MSKLSRRTFLARTAVAAAAVTGGAVTLAGVGAPALVTAAPRSRSPRPTRGDVLVAHVRDISTGEVAVLMGTREVVYRDRSLVAHLLAAVRG